jgi:hypothetical protein
LILISINPSYTMRYELDNGTMASPLHDCYKFYDVYNSSEGETGKCNPGANVSQTTIF